VDAINQQSNQHMAGVSPGSTESRDKLEAADSLGWYVLLSSCKRFGFGSNN
jgi:hypothetical protein